MPPHVLFSFSQCHGACSTHATLSSFGCNNACVSRRCVPVNRIDRTIRQSDSDIRVKKDYDDGDNEEDEDEEDEDEEDEDEDVDEADEVEDDGQEDDDDEDDVRRGPSNGTRLRPTAVDAPTGRPDAQLGCWTATKRCPRAEHVESWRPWRSSAGSVRRTVATPPAYVQCYRMSCSK